MPASVLDIRDFWGVNAYLIGGHVFSLDIIEHGILRGNRCHPTTKKTFLNCDDPRIKYTSSNFDPRIHFALVCGAKVNIKKQTKHKTQNTKHKTQNTKHKTQNTKHKTQNTKHKQTKPFSFIF